MQKVSKEYAKSMQKPFRYRGYIKGSIGIINSDAQSNATTDTALAYFSDKSKPFNGYSVNQVYATAEEDFSKVDGSMYFPPKNQKGNIYYNQGIVVSVLNGSFEIKFGDKKGLDIKGLTIDFGEVYPVSITVSNGSISKTYLNDTQNFVTDDSFDNSDYIRITPSGFSNGSKKVRMRINKMSFGVVTSFGSDKILECSLKEYVSPISDSLPSRDLELTIDNQDGYFNPDKEQSAIGYLELGQEVRISYGYDVKGDGVIEWIPETLTYLKTWQANDTQAKLTATDLFDTMDETYYGGSFNSGDGRTAYDLAIAVLTDAGFSESQYYLDPYLKTVNINNAIPAVTHSEALQIIANASRCVLSEDRKGKINIHTSFEPAKTVTTNGETEYSHSARITERTRKDAYAVTSLDFSATDGSLLFMPSFGNYKSTGYISSAVSKADGTFDVNPKINVKFEFPWTAYNFTIKFRKVVPLAFTLTTYSGGTVKETKEITLSSEKNQPAVTEVAEDPYDSDTYELNETFDQIDEFSVEFTKATPNSRVFVDYLNIGESTDYRIRRVDILDIPQTTKQDKVRAITVDRTVYRQSIEEDKELVSETISLTASNMTHTVYFNSASYGFSVSTDNSAITGKIVASSNFYAKIQFSGVTKDTTLTVTVKGKEYQQDTNRYTKVHNKSGSDVEWKNPLISTVEHAKKVEEWLASYYLGCAEYEFNWRGDPAIDANDTMYFGLKDGREKLIRAYENSLTFNGSWNSDMKAREVNYVGVDNT